MGVYMPMEAFLPDVWRACRRGLTLSARAPLWESRERLPSQIIDSQPFWPKIPAIELVHAWPTTVLPLERTDHSVAFRAFAPGIKTNCQVSY